ncbi:M20 metallopeptidase family protein [Owenweeksia hongkongensis]|uniref:M20 metallopeptidase family protein n=1 Tax=Owenweeksia hongkongensis TaxID=253245 RepID=UPI003A8FB965
MTAEDLKQIRRHLHIHPEVSTEEVETQRYVKKHLEKLNHDDLQEVGKTGLVIFFKGKDDGKKILLRGDMDALPIQEINDFAHKSVNEGVSHKCGHDGHTTILLGVANHLSENRPVKGEVCLVFQPAEENGKGAKAILEDPNFSFDADKAYALHNLPGYPLHKVVCRKSSFTAAAKSVIFKLNGKTSHAAEPEKGINPGLAISEILQLSESLSEKDINKDDFRLITMVHVEMGEKAYGISAGYGEVHFTLRTWRNDVMQMLDKSLVEAVEHICAKQNLRLEKEYLEIFHANDNDDGAYEIIKQAAANNSLSFENRETPFKWGEDFGLFTEKYKGAMFGIGSGENCPALHNPDYDYPDEITETGIKMFTEILALSQQEV